MNIGLDWIGLIGLALDGICLHVCCCFFFFFVWPSLSVVLV
jgi:hypothetical protein